MGQYRLGLRSGNDQMTSNNRLERSPVRGLRHGSGNGLDGALDESPGGGPEWRPWAAVVERGRCKVGVGGEYRREAETAMQVISGPPERLDQTENSR
jgi:hypothetical protein